VNGHVVRELPVLVDAASDRVCVDGKPIRAERKAYFLLHKPKGVVCTNDDPAGRRRAVDLLPGIRERIFPVGRLDAESTGLLLLTNDGELAQRITHPRFGVAKTYRAEVAGRMEEPDLERIRRGVWLSEGRTGPADVKITYRRPQSTIIEVTLREGRNREVRRVLAKIGHKVYRLVRIKIGPLSLSKLPLGAARSLRPDELANLKRIAGAATPHPPPPAVGSRWRAAASTDRSGRGRSEGRGRGDSRRGHRKSSGASWGR